MKLYIRDEDRYGIDVKKWAWEHEAYMKQHERLVHFLVTFLTVLAVMFDFALVLFLPSATGAAVAAIVLIGLLILLACYMYHYFVLENTVQHWYRIADRLHDRVVAQRQHEQAPASYPDTTAIHTEE